MLPYLARPLYHACGAHYLSEKAFYTDQSSVAMPILTGQVVSSLLPDAFNTLMCNALNYRDGETKVTHFVMLHGDIVPQVAWLSMMLFEMEATGVDILSAVVPIKAMHVDKTSTVCGKIEENHCCFRHISTAEAAELPPTFFADDVCREGERLMVNTGLMVVDLRKPWVAEWFATGGFRFETRAWQENGEWKSLCLPEDYLFSWDAQVKFGASVAATTKVRVLHYGDVGFENRRPHIETRSNPCVLQVDN